MIGCVLTFFFASLQIHCLVNSLVNFIGPYLAALGLGAIPYKRAGSQKHGLTDHVKM
jgi:hypothetical protein